MDVLVLDPGEQRLLLRRRKETGAERYDEAWDGVYVVLPTPDNEHHGLALALGKVVMVTTRWGGLGLAYLRVNVSDREHDWERNHRSPDLAVYLNGNPARDCGTHWLGGPDFAIEIVSRGDRSREKLPFYAGVGTRELMVVDRDPWALELYRLDAGRLVSVGTSTLDRPETHASSTLPLSFRLVAGDPRPSIEVVHSDGVQRWLA